MPDPADPEEQLKELQETIRILSLENEILAERAEDSALLGLIAEKIGSLNDPKAIIDIGLEQISLLKDIPLCVCCSIADGQIQIESSFVSFSDAALEGISLILPASFAASRFILLTGDDLHAADPSIGLQGKRYDPTSLLLIHFENSYCPVGFLVFADNGRLVHCQTLLMQVADMLSNRISNVRLIRELREAKEDLDAKIEERTRELSDAYRGLEQEMAEHLAAEKALRDSEEKYRSLFEESQDMVFISTYDGRFVDINPAGIARLGYSSKEELLRVPMRDAYAEPADRLQFLDLLNKDGFVFDFETVLLRRDAQKLYVSISATAIRDASGNITLIRGIIRDITEHRKLEDQFRQSQKMESIGTLAGGIAHDFNNILTAIIGYGHLTLRKMQTDDPNRLNLEQMLEAADRAAHLTKDLLLFSRKQPIHWKPIDLNEIIKRLEKFLIRVIGADIAFDTKLSYGEIPILADAHQIEQVLMNLATNARDAMPRGGALTVAVERTHLDERFVRLYGYGKPGVYAVVSVSDTGQGMDEQTRQKIFEPFYTTKEVGKGTGLGLAVVYGIVRQHEGYINVYSEPGMGTTFRIYLPVIGSRAEDEKTVTEEQPVGGTETILLAEDNESVRNLTTAVLQEFGYTVITAIDGQDAVSKYQEYNDRIQLLLFDLIMPRKSGKEAYEEIRKTTPDIKVLFASGYSPDIVQSKASLGNGIRIVFKPISPTELLRQVRIVLDERIN